MAELADAPALGAGEETHGSSSLPPSTGMERMSGIVQSLRMGRGGENDGDMPRISGAGDARVSPIFRESGTGCKTESMAALERR
jgi:hypothetical protein